MRKIQRALLLGMVFLLSGPAFAKSSSSGHSLFTVDVEPIIGYERVVKLVPTRHTTDRLIYGLRVTAGVPLIALETQYTRGTDTEDFSNPDLRVKDTTDKLNLGARSSIRLVSMLSLILRAGGQARKNVHEETSNGVTTTTNEPVYVSPYAGGGFRFMLTSKFHFDADLTVVFRDTHNLSDCEYQTTAGFAIQFP